MLNRSAEAAQTEITKVQPIAGQFPRFAPWLMLAARPALALLSFGLVLLLMRALKVPDALIEIRNWWTVYGTLVDLGCLAILVWLLKREGIRLKDLIGFEKKAWKRDVLIGLAIFALVFPVCVFGGGMLAGLIAYGNLNPALPEFTFIRQLPLLAALYSKILWWPLWSLTEELTYNGYTLPRLQKVTGSRWLPVLLVSAFWSLQHSFMPWVNPQHALYLFLMFVPLTLALQVIFLKVRRLAPMIVGHWLMDLASALFMIQIG